MKSKSNLIRAEFHVHTCFSNDSILNIYLLLLKCKIRKIKLIAITDHNEIKGALKCKELFEKFNIHVIVGEEIMTSDGEIIGLYLYEKIAAGLDVGLTIKKIKEQNGLVYLPHPYDEKRYKTVLGLNNQMRYKNDIDFIEVYNGRNIKNIFAVKQKEIQEQLNIMPIVGSDAHTFIEIGRNYIIMDFPTKDTLKTCIEKSVFVKKRCLKSVHLITKFARLIKYIESGDICELYRVIIKKCRRKK